MAPNHADLASMLRQRGPTNSNVRLFRAEAYARLVCFHTHSGFERLFFNFFHLSLPVTAFLGPGSPSGARVASAEF